MASRAIFAAGTAVGGSGPSAATIAIGTTPTPNRNSPMKTVIPPQRKYVTSSPQSQVVNPNA